jgi:DNA repair exonuclease SbcCD ATPase subunit
MSNGRERRMTHEDAPARTPLGEEPRGIRERLSTQAEDAIGRLADDLLENPLVNSALQQALTAREKVARAQETAMEALNIPSASNLDDFRRGVQRSLRAITQRLEDLEAGIDRIERRLEDRAAREDRFTRLDSRLDELTRDVAALRRELTPGETVPAAQTRAPVPEG